MLPICWLHISDIHLRLDNEWPQDVVLKAMCGHIREQREAGTAADFILVTGDIAFSGKSEQYALAKKFFNDLQASSGVPKERIFCIAGNHDIDRDRQEYCFQGTRNKLRGPSQVDSFLAGGEDLDTLLLREENYRQFQESYFAEQERIPTNDGLGYVSRLEINEIQLAIVGLDSAWLSVGGADDHGKLLLGERQAINAIELARGGSVPPTLIVGMAHHPLHLLQDFDRQPVKNRIEGEFHFFHCGHLHEPEAHITGPGASGCLTLVTGASFETRQARNAYYIVKLDLLHAARNVTSFQYNPIKGVFSLVLSEDYQIDVSATGRCGVGQLATAMKTYCPALAPWAHYLSALLLSQKVEFPIPIQNSYIFGPLDVLRALSDCNLRDKTVEFMTFRNILGVLYDREPLSEILAQYGDSIRKYGEALTLASGINLDLRQRLEDDDNDSRLLAKGEPQEAFSYTLDLFNELAKAGEWDSLREEAESLLGFGDLTVANQAERMLALALANSDEPQDREKAIKYYRSLVQSGGSDFNAIGNLAILLMETGCMHDASVVILDGIKSFPKKRVYFSEIGQQIVEATGNRKLRWQIEEAMKGKT